MKLIQMLRVTIVITMISVSGIVFAACSEEGPAEKAGKELDDVMEQAGDELEDATDKLEDVGDKIEEKADAVKEKAQKTMQ